MRREIFVLFLGLSFFIFAAKIMAAPQIVITNLPPNLTAGQSFNLTADISGLASSSAYYSKVRLGATTSSLSKGQTFNSNWLSDTDAWTSFPMINSDASGLWSGTIQARPASDAIIGQNYIALRIRKTDGTTNYDSSLLTASVSSALVVQTSTVTQTVAAVPLFDWQLPSSATLGQNFKISLNLTSFLASTQYYLKLRGGPDVDHLTKVQTKNNGNFFSDNEGWENFPQFTTDSSGKWSGEVWGLFTQDKASGNYQVLIRVKKQDKDTFNESGLKTMNLSRPAVSENQIMVAAVPVPMSDPILVASAETEIATASQVLGTESGQISTPSNDVIVPKIEAVKKNSFSWDPFSIGLIICGLVFLTICSYSIIKGKFRKL